MISGSIIWKKNKCQTHAESQVSKRIMKYKTGFKAKSRGSLKLESGIKTACRSSWGKGASAASYQATLYWQGPHTKPRNTANRKWATVEQTCPSSSSFPLGRPVTLNSPTNSTMLSEFAQRSPIDGALPTGCGWSPSQEVAWLPLGNSLPTFSWKLKNKHEIQVKSVYVVSTTLCETL